MYLKCPRTFYESRVAIHTPITQTKHDKIAACSANGPSPWVCAGGRLIIASISTPIKCPRPRLGSLRKESGGPGQKGARQRTVGRHGGGTVGLDSLRKWGPWTRGGWWRGGTVGGGEHTYTRTLWCAAPLCPRPPPAGLLSLAYASFQVSDAHDANMKTREPVITRSPPHAHSASADSKRVAAGGGGIRVDGGRRQRRKELRKSGSRDGSGTQRQRRRRKAVLAAWW